MIYLKSFLAGMLAAVVASVLYILVVFVLPIALPFLLSRVTGSGGVAAATFSTGPLLLIAILAFAFGSYWQFRRSSR